MPWHESWFSLYKDKVSNIDTHTYVHAYLIAVVDAMYEGSTRESFCRSPATLTERTTESSGPEKLKGQNMRDLRVSVCATTSEYTCKTSRISGGPIHR